jgi:hypothetical protein
MITIWLKSGQCNWDLLLGEERYGREQGERETSLIYSLLLRDIFVSILGMRKPSS